MGIDSGAAHQFPGIDTAGMIELRLTEAKLAGLNRQLRCFGPIRHRAIAAGQDPAGLYRTLQESRDKLAAAVRQSEPTGTPTRSPYQGQPAAVASEPLWRRPIAAAEFIAKLGWGFGTAGAVQVGPATDDLNIVATGKYPVTGEIGQILGTFPGDVDFEGFLSVGPAELPPGQQFDPAINYFWLRSWQYVVPFPPAHTLSVLTYRFDASAAVGIFNQAIDAEVLCFVSLGETTNLLTGQPVPVDINGCWPIADDDLSVPQPLYNGFRGLIEGTGSVERSFEVGSGNVPGIVVVVGVICGMSMGSMVGLTFTGEGNSGIAIGSQNMTGRIEYSYTPVPVAEP
jgi:hypothetical protein